jgi:uncharacterized protein DUF5677
MVRHREKRKDGATRRTHPSAKQVLDRIKRLERHLNNLKMIPARSLYRNAVVLGLLSKALTVGRAICVLVDAGFPGEAFATSRTLIEIYFCLRYIGNKNTEQRAETYVKYHAKVLKEWQTIIMKYYPNTPRNIIALDEDTLETAEEFKSKAHWTGQGGQAKLMALEEDTVEIDEQGLPVKSEFDYDAIYFWTSHFVHVTVIALDEHGNAGEVFKVRGRKWAGKGHERNALFNTLVFLSKMFVVAFRAMNEEQPENILQDINQLMEKFVRNNVP